jgi:GNAT superfamily N-acetyltransferase
VEIVDVALVDTYRLRAEVLGWDPPHCRIDDAAAEHLAIVESGAPIAVVSHSHWPCPDDATAPARYFWAMAVDGTRQRRGLGRSLLDALAARARTNGETLMWADARESAVGFYAALGARRSGAAPEIDDITGLVNHRVVFDLGLTDRDGQHR